MIRLDKLVATSLVVGRRDASDIIRKGRISVDGKIVKSADAKIDENKSTVEFDGRKLVYSEYIYIMLNKPAGLVCSSEDRKDTTVISIFPKEYTDKKISCVGRLDKDTTGLLLVTNDGELAHNLLSPKHHAEKKYFVTCDKPFEENDIEIMKKGIVIEGKNTAPAKLELLDDEFSAFVTLTEGKFHEVKRLCYACGEKEVIKLDRTEFAGLKLDETLDKGEWRLLTEQEIKFLKD